MDAPPATLIVGRYRLSQELGRGGMGVVYGGLDPVLDRPVAIKIAQLPGPAESLEYRVLRERAIREGRAAGALAHPNIVTVYDTGEEAGRLYTVMEYVEGCTLEALMASHGTLPISYTCEVLAQIAGAWTTCISAASYTAT